MNTLRLGTRGSLLARTQSGQVAAAITAATGVPVELVIIKTRGDQIQDRPLQQVGGKGLFTKEIEDAMIRGDVDLAVHSMKDMPTENPPELEISAIPERVDPRDVLVGARLEELPRGAVVGTGSVRRRMQLLQVRPDLEIRGIRGNVDTRIAKQQAGEYQAIMLAMAGMKRLGRGQDATEALPLDLMVPAVGQGALAVQCRRDDARVKGILNHIHHGPTASCVAAERSFLVAVEGGCSAPAACHVVLEEGLLVATGVYAPDDSHELHRLVLRSSPMHGVAMGRELARKLIARSEG